MLIEMKFKIGEKEIVLSGDDAYNLYMELKQYFEPRNVEIVPDPVYPNTPWYRDWWYTSKEYPTIITTASIGDPIIIEGSQIPSDGTVHVYCAEN